MVVKGIINYIFLFSFLIASCGNEPINQNGSTTPAAKATDSTTPHRVEPSYGIGREMESTAEVDTAGDIQQIRAQYQEIVNGLQSNQYKHDTISTMCTTKDEDVLLIRHFDGQQNVVMMEYTHGIGHSYTIERIYFKNGDPFFAFIIEDSWSPGGPMTDQGPGTTSHVKEFRYYIRDGIIIRKLQKSFTQRSWTDDPGSDQIPNQTDTSQKGKPYPDMQLLKELRQGRVNC